MFVSLEEIDEPARGFGIRRCTDAIMPLSTPLSCSDEETVSSDALPLPDDLPAGDDTPGWLWVLVRATDDPPEQVWVRFFAEAAPEGLAVRRAAPPMPRSLGVAIIRLPPTLRPKKPPEISETPQRRRYRARRPRVEPTDRNFVTVSEFAALVPCSVSSVHDLIKLGLPSRKIPSVGRRIMKKEALEWLIAGGARTSKVALKLARAAYRAKKARENGAADGAE
jgi:hypothetical protein